MEEQFQKEGLVKESSEFEKEIELVRSIIKTREELKRNSKNFEFAEFDLVDYYIYQIKANQAKLNYLLKLAKASGITIDSINQIKYENYDEEIG
ncbi:MAG: YaaL family protein [Clostridia bacterium]|nr:YaaL family protein [Clostridia bacterium]